MNAFDIVTLCIGIVAFAVGCYGLYRKQQATATLAMALTLFAFIAISQDMNHRSHPATPTTHHSGGAP